MAKIRRVIRKTRPAGRSAFDEQYWPVILALFVLGGFLLGTVSAYLDHHDPRWYANAWTWMFAIPIAICLALWSLRKVNSRVVKRGVQFSAILCVILHVVLFVAALETNIFGRLWKELASDSQVSPLREPIVEPEYEPFQLDPQQPSQQVILRPVETETPDPIESELRPQKQPPERQPTAPRETPEPQPDPQAVANLPQRQARATTVPRYSEQLAQLSRQPADARPQTAQPTTPPRLDDSSRPQSSPFSAQQQPVQPRATSTQVVQPEVSPRVEQPAIEKTANLARQLDHEAPQTERVEASVPRASTANSSRAVPAIELPDNPSPTKQQVQAQATATRQSPATASANEAPAAALGEIRSNVSNTPRRATRQRAAEPLPAVAAAPRRARQLSSPETTAAAQVKATGSVATRSRNVQPQTRQVRRAADAAPAITDSNSAAQLATRPAATRSNGEPRRATPTQSTPSIVAASQPTRAARRTNRGGGIRTASQPQGVGSVAQTRTGEDEAPQPARLALTRSLSGSAGVGQSPNLDRAFPAADSPAMIASGSARRTQATQQMPEGPALAPSAKAVVRHSVTDSQQPGATLQATTAAAAPQRGAAQPSELKATASAATRRTASDADPSTVTAAAGVIDVDIGATRIVDGGGTSRAAGGGQPDLQLDGSPHDLPPRRSPSQLAGMPSTAAQAEEVESRDQDEGAPVQNRNDALTPPTTGASRGVADAVVSERQASASGSLLASSEATPPLSIARSIGSAGAADRPTDQGTFHRAGRSRDVRGPRVETTGPVVALSSQVDAPERNSERGGPAGGTKQPATSAQAALASAGESELPPTSGAAAARSLPDMRRQTSGQAESSVSPEAANAAAPRRASGMLVGGPRLEISAAAAAPEGDGAEAEGDSELLASNTSAVRHTVGSDVALPLDVDLDPGSGGLGVEPHPDAGIRSRRASQDSVQIELQTGRFRRQRVGGLPSVNPGAVVATDPFRRRSDRMTGDEARLPGSPGPETEEAIELGLAFLARYQLPDGSWSLQAFDEEVALGSDSAATGLALLAFQGAGYNHREQQYADVIAHAIKYLVDNQKEDGDLFVPLDTEHGNAVWLYSHGIAALALSEAYGMTQDPELAQPAQRAIDFIVDSQDKEHGGWRYRPGFSSDTSVTGWMMMALKSAELANLKVSQPTYDRARKWLNLAQASRGQPHLYRYNPFAADTPAQRHGRSASPTMTSVGLLVRLYDGWRRDQEALIRGADYLLDNLPSVGTRRQPERDTYYWYYGTQVMFHMGGDYWRQWNGQLHPLLVEGQIKQGRLAGSWNPQTPVPDRWAPHAGRLYVTTMNLLSLEVFYRHLPLYDDTAR